MLQQQGRVHNHIVIASMEVFTIRCCNISIQAPLIVHVVENLSLLLFRPSNHCVVCNIDIQWPNVASTYHDHSI